MKDIVMTIIFHLFGKKHIALLLLFIVTVILPAQTRQWSLEDCIRHAVEHNSDVKKMNIQKIVAEISLNTAQMSRLPNLNVGIGQNWNFGRTQVASGLYENRSQSNTSLSISSSVPVFTGFRIPNEIARSRLELQIAFQNLEKAKDDLSLNITSLFLQVVFCKELLKISSEQLELSLSQVERTKILVDEGKVPNSQLFDIQAQVANEIVSVIQSENNLKLALLDLAQNIELESNVDFDILVPDFNDILAENQTLMSTNVVFDNAVHVKPVIKAQELMVESAEKTLNIAKSGYLPSLNLTFGYGTNYFYLYEAGYANRSFSNQLKNNAGEYIGLSLNIPLFNRFSVRNQVRNAGMNIATQQLTLENTKKTLYKEIQTACLNVIAAQEKYKAAQEAVKSTAEAFMGARERYESGKSSVFEFNEAKNKLAKSQSEALQSKYDFLFRTKIVDYYNGEQ